MRIVSTIRLNIPTPQEKLHGLFLPGIGSIIDAMLWSGLNYAYNAGSDDSVDGMICGMMMSGVTASLSMSTSMVIGDMIGHSVGNIGTEFLRAGMHGVVGGSISAIYGDDFLSGFAGNAVSSLAGSIMQSSNVTEPLSLAVGGAISEATSSAVSGGDWRLGAFNGFVVGFFNHGEGGRQEKKQDEQKKNAGKYQKYPENETLNDATSFGAIITKELGFTNIAKDLSKSSYILTPISIINDYTDYLNKDITFSKFSAKGIMNMAALYNKTSPYVFYAEAIYKTYKVYEGFYKLAKSYIIQGETKLYQLTTSSPIQAAYFTW
ncbi:MAG: hypothetical protein ACLSWM_08110 [Barnesiella sp.]